jgi:DNA-binding PucR family transcriptional regulator
MLRMDELWPPPSPRIQKLIRRGAEIALHPRVEWTTELNDAALAAERMRDVVADPALGDALQQANIGIIVHWAAANVQRPGRRVVADLDAGILDSVRDLVRRGFVVEKTLDSYRIGQGVAWRMWMEICFELTTDAAELHELLQVTAKSIATFVDDALAAIFERMAAERDDLTRGTHAERRAIVALILEGAPISMGSVEAQLGYALTGPHLGAIIWGPADAGASSLETAAEALVKTVGAPRRLTVVASAGALWIWLPVGSTPGSLDLGRRLDLPAGTRVAIGRPRAGLEGFRRTHVDALATQRMLSRLSSPWPVAQYDDVQLVALMTADPSLADEFVADVLGRFADVVDEETHEAVLTYVEEQCNTSHTALRLHTHRNTILRRLARADELLPRPLAQNPVEVAAALKVLLWRGVR